ncbi:MAG: hypothetical protein V1809_00785 [Planctomycetota bacterium]
MILKGKFPDGFGVIAKGGNVLMCQKGMFPRGQVYAVVTRIICGNRLLVLQEFFVDVFDPGLKSVNFPCRFFCVHCQRRRIVFDAINTFFEGGDFGDFFRDLRNSPVEPRNLGQAGKYFFQFVDHELVTDCTGI